MFPVEKKQVLFLGVRKEGEDELWLLNFGGYTFAVPNDDVVKINGSWGPGRTRDGSTYDTPVVGNLYDVVLDGWWWHANRNKGEKT